MTRAATPVPPVRNSGMPGIMWPALLSRDKMTLLALRQQLERSQWWPADYSEEVQLGQLEEVLDHAVRTVPLYRERFGPLGLVPGEPLTAERWRTLPLLTRKDVQDSRALLRSDDVPGSHGKVSQTSTSGSTGSPVTTYKTALEQVMFRAASLREIIWHRPAMAGKFAVIRRDRYNTSYAPEGHGQDDWGEPASSLYPTGPGVLLDIFFEPAHQIEWLVREAPDYLLTLPSNIKALALFARERGIVMPPIRQIRTYGEALASDTRDLCREVWRAKLVDNYSAEEIGNIALQCPMHEHYHVQSEFVHVEVLDPSGRPCKPGETGQVVLTTLHNFAMPLIRYAIGDHAEVGPPCPCGRTLPVLKRILGRTRNMLVLPSGVRRFAVMLGKVVSKIPAVVQQQVVQTTLSNIEIRLVVKRPLTAVEEEHLIDDVAAQLVEPFNIRVVYVNEIARSREGKYEDFRSEVATA